jgi:hypothetical protein
LFAGKTRTASGFGFRFAGPDDAVAGDHEEAGGGAGGGGAGGGGGDRDDVSDRHGAAVTLPGIASGMAAGGTSGGHILLLQQASGERGSPLLLSGDNAAGAAGAAPLLSLVQTISTTSSSSSSNSGDEGDEGTQLAPAGDDEGGGDDGIMRV